MRTTISIDDALLAAAKSLARSVSVGTVISELVRKGLEPPERSLRQSGFPVFCVPSTAHQITLDDVKRLEDEE
ncbi:MAG: antitoxin [Chloroflexi bacterium]|nr:antitoxin [Chloroflexota bacterium]